MWISGSHLLKLQSGFSGGVRVEKIKHRIRRIAPPLPGFSNTEIAIPSPDGRELFKFNATGQHVETLNAFTGAMRLRFGYDKAGRLA